LRRCGEGFWAAALGLKSFSIFLTFFSGVARVWHGIRFVSLKCETVVIESNKSGKLIGRMVRLGLLAGIIYFGFVFPDSLSDHEKMLHFSAHVGMSFFVASCIYVLCNIMLRISKAGSMIILIATTLIIGAIYKYLEIAGEGLLHAYSFNDLMKVTGVYTSMSQNTAGILAAILLIEYVLSYFRIVIQNRINPGSHKRNPGANSK
jgi:hypothetical protein